MNIASRALLLVLLALPLAGVAFAQHAHHAAPGDTAPVPAPAARWPADAALQGGMGRIHVALEELRHYEMGHMDATMALDRVGLIEQAAADIFATCKLPAERNAVLHRMLVPLLAAAQKLKADPDDIAQVQAMRDALADYPHYFADPGWTAAAAH
ncbi:DnrO protein [Dyella sp. KRB-257]|uniref:DnrO protein n=1 Tax=Dyella sp. KRB-257 TaxID=3400915 RepID=UPI003C06D3BF